MRFMSNMSGGVGHEWKGGRAIGCCDTAFYFVIATFADFTGGCRGRRASMYTFALWRNDGSRVVTGAYIDCDLRRQTVRDEVGQRAAIEASLNQPAFLFELQYRINIRNYCTT